MPDLSNRVSIHANEAGAGIAERMLTRIERLTNTFGAERKLEIFGQAAKPTDRLSAQV